MDKIKIFICCHKPCNPKHNEVYTPFNHGRKVSPYKGQMDNMIGDDVGDNISEKQPIYNEHVATYWIWKNVHNVEYVGICHYRRFLGYDFTPLNTDALFADGTDVIMGRKGFYPKTRWSGLIPFIQIEDFLIVWGSIKKICPDYLPTMLQYLNGYYSYNYNLIVCRKVLFDKFAEWMFSIFDEVEKYYRPSGYANSKRSLAYIAEVLTAVYFIHNKCKIKEMPIVFEGKEVPNIGFKWRCLRAFLQNIVWRLTKNRPIRIDPSVYRGMKEDGIELDCSMEII